MPRYLLRFLIFAVFLIVSYFSLTSLKNHLDPNTGKSVEEGEDARWIATSKHWLDRNACRYIAICGLAHYHPDPAAIPWRKRKELERVGGFATSAEKTSRYEQWEEALPEGGKLRPEDFNRDQRVLRDVPQFVLDAAPLIHLYSGEDFWPSDIGDHLRHMAPHLNHTMMKNVTERTLHNLDELDEGLGWQRGKFLFMKSKEDVEHRPEWLSSAYNKPIPYEDDQEEDVEVYTEFVDMDTSSEETQEWLDPFGKANSSSNTLHTSSSSDSQPHPDLKRRNSNPRKQRPIKKPDTSGYSPAPVIVIMVDKGNGILDAFWFYFYSYNLGTTVLNIRFGNHIGDWEHSLIRFHHGVPKAVFFSAHSGGTAFTYKSVEKGKGKGREGRPVLFSALGSHAMYAQPGKHPYVLPFGLLADLTDRGPLWDPALNYMAYHYNTSITHDVDAKFTPSPHSQLEPASCNPNAPMSWFWFTGHWGDKFYELGDLRQWRFAGQHHYVNGPLGPRYKNLGRSKVCQSGRGSDSCRILDSISGGRSWLGRRR
ncbi:hypothetical protein BJ878DRAFT_446781 [Calycina marina]|uniref:Uncharacterized protein n=1 Tax=Calycina marina TaxID=1763456 RepID=A0A9P8CCL7_9HELO|nr:hypothetical protein BJ878DRAFT_446781 [Calycina marina]